MDVEKQQDEVALRLGASLTQAREACGLTITDIANQLHLKQSFVQALETGDYQIIGSMVYVKGYLRIYLRLLHLESESDIALLKSDAIMTDKVKTSYADALNGHDKVTKSSVRYGKSRKSLLKKVAVFVLLLLIIGWLFTILHKYPPSKVLIMPPPVNQSRPEVSQQNLSLPPSTLSVKPTTLAESKVPAVSVAPVAPVMPVQNSDTDDND